MIPDDTKTKLIVTDQQNKKDRINMKTKTKNDKVPKSGKTKFSDLTPKKDARGGTYPSAGGPAPSPVARPGFPSAVSKKRVTQ
jgi:hypothetical protein